MRGTAHYNLRFLIEFIRRINEAVESGDMTPKVALDAIKQQAELADARFIGGNS